MFEVFDLKIFHTGDKKVGSTIVNQASTEFDTLYDYDSI